MSAIVRSVHPVEPIDLLKEAVEAAKLKGIRVRVGQLGVYPVSQHAGIRWELDPLCMDGAVDVLGATLLMAQPPALEPAEAASQALGLDMCAIEGLVDGMDLAPKEPIRMQSPRRDLYLKYYEMGVTLRVHVQSRDVAPAVAS